MPWTPQAHPKSSAHGLCRSCQGWHIANGGRYMLERIAWRCSGGLQGLAHQACPPLGLIWASRVKSSAHGLCRSCRGGAYSQRWALRARKNCVALLGRASGPRTPGMSTTGTHLGLTCEVERPRVVPELPGVAYSQRWALHARKNCVALLGRATGPRTPGMSTTGTHLGLTREVERPRVVPELPGVAYSQRWALHARKNWQTEIQLRGIGSRGG